MAKKPKGASARKEPQSQTPPDEEAVLFRHAMAGVTPLRHREPARAMASVKPVHRRSEVTQTPPKKIAAAQEHHARSLPHPRHIAPPPAGKGIDKKQAARLQRGRMEIEAVLDLHGDDQRTAEARLRQFILSSYHKHRRCVLVITGKGKIKAEGDDAGFFNQRERGVLRRNVPLWLAQPDIAPLILTHSPAQHRDGGEGALYILLRRQRPSASGMHP